MNPVEDLVEKLPAVEHKIGYAFHSKSLLVMAFVHRSFYNEHREQVEQHNERLEFLGDSVLGLILSDYLYAHLPSYAEGQLSHLRSHLVEANSCVQYLNKLGIAEYVLLGKGERMNDGRGRDTILADLFEALIGAIYLDGGLDAAKKFFISHFQLELTEAFQAPQRNWKAELQDYSQKKHQKPPTYKVIKESGPDHSKMFHVSVSIGDREVGAGEGSSKKAAEQAAAEDAMKKLQQE